MPLTIRPRARTDDHGVKGREIAPRNPSPRPNQALCVACSTIT